MRERRREPDEEQRNVAADEIDRRGAAAFVGNVYEPDPGLRLQELAALHPQDVTSLLGQAIGAELHRLAQGIDDHPVAERAEAKQVSAETTFDHDINDRGTLLAEVMGQADNAHRRLVSSGRAARTVTLKVRDSDFTTISRAETFSSATSELHTLAAAARRLLPIAVPPGTPVRLVGVSYSGLANSEQESLFDHPADPEENPEPEPEAPESTEAAQRSSRQWRAGDDVLHSEYGHGWVQGAGHGRVTVRFETAATGRGVARTFAVDDPQLSAGDPLDSLGSKPISPAAGAAGDAGTGPPTSAARCP